MNLLQKESNEESNLHAPDSDDVSKGEPASESNDE